MTIPEERAEGAQARDEVMVSRVPPPPPTAAYAAPLVARRPVSVIVIAILFFIGVAMEVAGLFQAVEGSSTFRLIGQIDSVVFALLQTVVGIALLQMRPWARVTAIITIIVRYVTTLPFIYIGSMYAAESNGLQMNNIIGSCAIIAFFLLIYFAILIIVLTRPGVKAAFAR